MNVIKNILGRIFALWALILFSSTIIIIALIALVIGLWPEPKRSIIMYQIFVAWMNLFFFLIGVKRVIKGKENFKKGENYVVVCNHQSFMDVPLSSPGIPGPNKTIAKVEMSRIPVFGIVYKRGSVLVDRKNEESRRQSYARMKEVLEMGLHMCIYPEGTRNKTKEPLQKFHDGAFRLAVESGKAIIPSLIFGTTKVLPRNKIFFFWPRKVEMHFLPPISSNNITTAELKDKTYSIMKEYLLQHQ